MMGKQSLQLKRRARLQQTTRRGCPGVKSRAVNVPKPEDFFSCDLIVPSGKKRKWLRLGGTLQFQDQRRYTIEMCERRSFHLANSNEGNCDLRAAAVCDSPVHVLQYRSWHFHVIDCASVCRGLLLSLSKCITRICFLRGQVPMRPRKSL